MKSKITQFVCNRCGYTWIPRSPDPKVCARCRSPYWNSERKNKVGNDVGSRIDDLKKSLS